MRIDPDTCRDPDLLAGEVRRLRAAISSEQTLTHKERDAVEVALEFCERTDKPLPTSDQVAALRSLLERTNPRLAALQKLAELDEGLGLPRTPTPHSNQREVSVRPECAISPPWMARPFYVDPAEGWAYGFPRLYDPAKDGDMTEWMVANGYPQHLADQNLPCTFTAERQHLD